MTTPTITDLTDERAALLDQIDDILNTAREASRSVLDDDERTRHDAAVARVEELDGLIAARGLKGIVRRVGHCTDMPAAFLAASVVTVPSTEPEAFGRSAVEAQAMGTPVADRAASPSATPG